MSTKYSLLGTAKQIGAEIVGDGKLAEEGARQANGSSLPTSDTATEVRPPQEPSKPLPSNAPDPESQHLDEHQFTNLLGRAALKAWPDLPRDVQKRLFAAAADDALIANSLAEFLHDHYPRTVHPPKPTRMA